MRFYTKTSMRCFAAHMNGLTFTVPTLFPLSGREGSAAMRCLKEKFGGAPFDKWPNKYKFARAKSLQKFKKENEKEYLFWQFLQYEFSLQWKALKGYANKKGVSIIGDIPLYVAYDSADVWLNPKLFKLT